MRRILTTLLLLTCLACGAGASDHASSIEALRDHQGRISCTVFSINDKEHLWMTAHHCVAAAEDTAPTTYRDVYVRADQAKVYKDFPEFDVTILHTEREWAPALFLANREPEVGDAIEVSGHGLGWESLTKFMGRVANVYVASPEGDRFYTIYDMSVFPGHSGSPVMSHGKVIGVMQISVMNTASGGCTWADLVRSTWVYWRT